MNSNKSTLFIKSTLTKVLLIAFVYQLYLDSSFENVISNVLVVLTSLFLFNVVLNNKLKSISNAFLATIVFSTILSNSLVPLIATCIEQKALIYKLLLPVEVFFIRFLYAILVLLAYGLLVNKQYSNNSFFLKLSNVLKINFQLSYKQIWIWGITGIFFFIAQGFVTSVFLSKFLAGFNFLLWTPFVLLIHPYFEITKRKKHFKFLIFYFLLMIVLASIRNSRMGFVGPLMVVAFGLLFSVFLGKIDLEGFIKHNKMKVIFSFIGFFIFFSFLIKLSDAITYSRKFRSDVSPSELVYLTYLNFFNENKDTYIEESSTTHDREWSEDYVDNAFLARFINIKFDDNCLVRIKRFSEEDMSLLWQFNNENLISILPSPALNALGITVDKLNLGKSSTGDYIDYLANGNMLEGKKTGSFIVHTYALFGNWAIIIVFLLVYLAYSLYAVILYRKHYKGVPTFALIMLWFFYLETNPESFTDFMSFFLRGVLQTLLLYGLMIKFSSPKN